MKEEQPHMEITQSTVPEIGTLHYCVSRDGNRLGILIARSNRRQLVVYSPVDADEQIMSVDLDNDEADALADLLHSRSIPDRIAELERRLIEITGH